MQSSMRTHGAEAVIQHAILSTSVYNGVSGYSSETSTDAHGKTRVQIRDGAAAAPVRPVHEYDGVPVLKRRPVFQ